MRAPEEVNMATMTMTTTTTAIVHVTFVSCVGMVSLCYLFLT